MTAETWMVQNGHRFQGPEGFRVIPVIPDSCQSISGSFLTAPPDWPRWPRLSLGDQLLHKWLVHGAWWRLTYHFIINIISIGIIWNHHHCHHCHYYHGWYHRYHHNISQPFKWQWEKLVHHFLPSYHHIIVYLLVLLCLVVTYPWHTVTLNLPGLPGPGRLAPRARRLRWPSRRPPGRSRTGRMPWRPGRNPKESEIETSPRSENCNGWRKSKN